MTRKDKIYAGLLAVFPLVLFFPMFFSGKIIAWLDMLFYFLPFRELTSGLIQHGVMPFWNPLIYCGNPLMANMQSAVFYPLNIFYHVLPAMIAVRATTYIIYLVMALFTYGFMRLYDTSEEGSFVAAFLFCFSFYAMVKAVELAEINVMGWIPAALYFIKKYSASGRSHDKFLAAMMLTLSLLGGHPQFFIYGYIIFAAFYFYELIYRKKGARSEGVRDFFIINLILLAVVLIQVVPTIRFLSLSKRAMGGLSLEENINSFMRFEQVACLFFPFLTSYFSKAAMFLNWMGLMDIGCLPLFLMALAAFKMRDRNLKMFVLILFTVSLFLALMGNMWFYSGLYPHLGFLSSIRYPSKIILIAYFVMCFLAAKGFDMLFASDEGELKGFIRGSLITAVTLLLAYLALDFFRDRILLAYKLAFDPLMNFGRVYDLVELFRKFLVSFMTYIILLFICVLVMYMAGAKLYRNIYMKAVAVIIIIAGAYIYNVGTYSLYADESCFSGATKQTDFLKAAEKEGEFRILAPGIINPFEHEVGYKNLSDLFYFDRDTLIPNVPMKFGFKNADGFDSLFLGDFSAFKQKFSSMAAPWDSSAFSLLSVKYISSRSEIKGSRLKLASKGYSQLYRNTNCLPEVFFIAASAPRVYASGKKAVDIIFSRGFNPAETLVLDEKYSPNEEKYSKARDGGTEIKGGSSIIYSRPDVNSFRIHSDEKAAGFAVITDNYYPGWTAYVDGKKEDVIKVYGGFKGVFMDTGSHEIYLNYTPPEFIPAAVISILALILLMPVVPALLALF